MRILIALLLLALPALAAPPDKIDEADHWRAQAAVLAEENARLQRQIVELRLQLKYALGPDDTYDPKTLVITRAPKPAPVKK